MRQIVQACFPESPKEAIELWHNIKPVKFGQRTTWAAGVVTLATYQIPEDAAYLLILKTECYTFTNVAAAPGFRNFEPPPNGSAQWVTNVGAGDFPLTNFSPIHLLAEASEFLFAKAGNSVTLQGTLDATPDANLRSIRTLVYSYQISAIIADRLGSGEVLTAIG
jgi:hypothetical protein